MSKLTSNIAATALILTGIAVLAPAGAQEKKQGKCFLAGGEATMVTTDLAKFMANAALNNSIKGASATAVGAPKMTCKDGIATVYCHAEQRACK